jgi:cellulose synthase/poly-beta-1,6-N-acetylglucosamine synthase-like glycosyltransferase
MQKERDPQADQPLSSAALLSNPTASIERRRAPDPRRTWKVSVVVPTCGRADLLDRCLSALTAQSVRAADMEIIVVDDAALEVTRAAIAGWSERMALRGLDVA